MFTYANPITWNHGGLMRCHRETADHLGMGILSTMKITLLMAKQQSEMNIYSLSVCMKELHISTKQGLWYQHKLNPQYNVTIYNTLLTFTSNFHI